MATTGKDRSLLDLSPDEISPNPDNPRMIFREHQMNELLTSIASTGIQVPITVYSDKGRYVILDGERRWRCARRLNLRKMPAIVHPKPTKLENLLMMFNIHNVRVQWDIMPMAYKLAEISELLAKAGQDNAPKALATITGVSFPTVKRCLELLDLPKEYRDLLMREAAKPKGEQLITADLFIEINRAYGVIGRYVPEVLQGVDKNKFTRAMVRKYTRKVIGSVTAFRDLSRLARAERAGADSATAAKAIRRVIRDPAYSIESAYKDTVEAAYERRDLVSKIDALGERLEVAPKSLFRGAPDLRNALVRLHGIIGHILN